MEKIRDKIKEDHLFALISGGTRAVLQIVIQRDMAHTLELVSAKYPVEIVCMGV